MSFLNGGAGLRIERPGFDPLPRHCTVFLVKTLYSHSAFRLSGVTLLVQYENLFW